MHLAIIFHIYIILNSFYFQASVGRSLISMAVATALIEFALISPPHFPLILRYFRYLFRISFIFWVILFKLHSIYSLCCTPIPTSSAINTISYDFSIELSCHNAFSIYKGSRSSSFRVSTYRFYWLLSLDSLACHFISRLSFLH